MDENTQVIDKVDVNIHSLFKPFLLTDLVSDALTKIVTVVHPKPLQPLRPSASFSAGNTDCKVSTGSYKKLIEWNSKCCGLPIFPGGDPEGK